MPLWAAERLAHGREGLLFPCSPADFRCPHARTKIPLVCGSAGTGAGGRAEKRFQWGCFCAVEDMAAIMAFILAQSGLSYTRICTQVTLYCASRSAVASTCS